MKKVTTVYIETIDIENAKEIALRKFYEDFNTSQLIGWLLRKFVGEN